MFSEPLNIQNGSFLPDMQSSKQGPQNLSTVYFNPPPPPHGGRPGVLSPLFNQQTYTIIQTELIDLSFLKQYKPVQWVANTVGKILGFVFKNCDSFFDSSLEFKKPITSLKNTISFQPEAFTFNRFLVYPITMDPEPESSEESKLMEIMTAIATQDIEKLKSISNIKTVLNSHISYTCNALISGISDTYEDLTFQTPLQLAAFKGNIEIFEYLMQQGADIARTPQETFYISRYAAMGGKVEMLKYLKNLGITLVHNFVRNVSLLTLDDISDAIPMILLDEITMALLYGNFEAAQYFLDNKLDYLPPDLRLGVVTGGCSNKKEHKEQIEFLIQHLHELDVKKAFACFLRVLETLDILANIFVNVVVSMVVGRTGCRDQKISLNKEESDVFDLFYQKGAFVVEELETWINEKVCDETKQLFLPFIKRWKVFEAAKKGDVESLKNFQSEGIVLKNLTYKKGQNIAHAAASQGQVGILKHLLENHFDFPITAEDADGLRCTHLAAQNGHLNVLEFLNENHALQNLKDNSNRTLLHYAATNGHIDVVTFLAKIFPDCLSAKDENGLTLAFWAAFEGQIKTLQALKVLNALTILDNEGENILHSAVCGGQLETLKALRELEPGLDFTQTNKQGKSLTHQACFGGYLPIVKWLYQQNLLSMDADKKGKKPVDYAEMGGYKDIVCFLQQLPYKYDQSNWRFLGYAGTALASYLLPCLLSLFYTNKED